MPKIVQMAQMFENYSALLFKYVESIDSGYIKNNGKAFRKIRFMLMCNEPHLDNSASSAKRIINLKFYESLDLR